MKTLEQETDQINRIFDKIESKYSNCFIPEIITSVSHFATDKEKNILHKLRLRLQEINAIDRRNARKRILEKRRKKEKNA